MFSKILIANRGEIAVRIIRACREMGIETVAVYSDVDQECLHAQLADEAICIGPAKSSESYLNMQNILSAAVATGAQAIHPGFGFLAENSTFASMCEECNIRFIGPKATVIDAMGNKANARALMTAAGVPVIPGSSGVLNTLEDAKNEARRLGYPVMVKASAGGGGKGIRVVRNEEALEKAYAAAKSETKAAFGDDSLYMEKLIEHARHIEIQILGDSFGNVVHLGERDYSLQRRNQKVLEECPSPALDEATRKAMGEAAVRAAKAVGYESAGTIEFLYDRQGKFYFMEMNTRINAEDPDRNFAPCPGTIDYLLVPGGCLGVRIDSAIYPGYTIPSFYDSMIAKVITYGNTRKEAIEKMRRCLYEFVISGIQTNIEFQERILTNAQYQKGIFDTDFLSGVILKESKGSL